MRALADLLAARNIPLTIVVYPWAQQLAQGDRDSRQVALWREFCAGRCKAFINLFPVFFAATRPTRTGTNISSFWATITTRRTATASCFWKSPGICFNALMEPDLLC